MVRFHLAVMGVLAGLLWACAATPAEPPMRIDEVTFLSGGGPTAEALVLGVKGTYTLRRVLPPSSGRAEVRSGTWRTVVAEQQLVLLDGQTLIRLIHNEGAAQNWRYVPIKVVPSGALPEGQRENYQYLLDRWYVAKADVAPEQGEDASPGTLLLASKTR